MRTARLLAVALATASVSSACTPSTLTARYTISPVLLGPVKTLDRRPLQHGTRRAENVYLRASNFRESSTYSVGNTQYTETVVRQTGPSQADVTLLINAKDNYRRPVVVDRIDCSGYALFAITWARTRTRCVAKTRLLDEPDNAPACPPALHQAAERGDAAAIRQAATGGVDIDCRRDGMTPLFRAARRGHVDAVRALLARGADARKTSALDRTPQLRRVPTLLVALPHPKVVVLLLAAGSKWIDWWAGGAVRCALPGQRFCRPRARALVQQLIREGKLSGDAHAETIAHAKTWRVRRPPLELLDDK